MFTSTRGQGFHVAFANGWKVSVQWGLGNYCENRRGTDADADPDMLQSHSAEVLVMRPDGSYAGDPKGWQTPEQVAALLARVARRKGPVVVASEVPHDAGCPAVDGFGCRCGE
jgi:hypothetical protein